MKKVDPEGKFLARRPKMLVGSRIRERMDFKMTVPIMNTNRTLKIKKW